MAFFVLFRPGVIIGVTNPFFTKCLQHWPNIIKVSDSNKLAANAQDGESNHKQSILII